MKIRNLFIISLFLCLLLGAIEAAVPRDKPLLVVLFMVKNEKEVIIPTLETYLSKKLLNGQPDDEEVAYVLYDTGSTDGTESMAEEFFKKHGIKNYTIAQEPWKNFADSRNRGLVIAREKYPDSTFILFPDADWYFNDFDGLLSFCSVERKGYDAGTKVPPSFYHLRIKQESDISLQPKLILTHNDVCFVGRTHEGLTKCSPHCVPESSYFIRGTSRCSDEANCKRWLRDRGLLIEDLSEDPQNSRATLYLGLTEYWLQNYPAAYTALKRRMEMPGYAYENYYALYSLAETADILSNNKIEGHSWDEALRIYLQAYSMRPHRAEPLVKIAYHYLEEQDYPLSYLFVSKAAMLPLPAPETEILPVVKVFYDYHRWEILSRVAWFMHEYEIGEDATLKAIEAYPNIPHLYHNLSYYWERVK